MYLVFENGAWVQRQPVDGELVREVISAGTSNEHYREYVYATPTPTPPDMRVTKLAFRNRFTFDEKVAIEDAAKVDTQVKVLLDDQKSATYIDLGRADTAAGLDLLVAKGLLTQQRRDEILNAPINDEDERP